MTSIILAIILRTLNPAPTEALVCEISICCDYCQPIGNNGLGYCRGCEGAGADGTCDSGQTQLDCPNGCYTGAGKLNTSSLGPNACK